MVFYVLFALCIAAECVAAPLYIYNVRSGYSNKTLFIKMVGSLLFLLIGLFAALAGGTIGTQYAKVMLVAFACAWVGDVFLHGKPGIVRIILGGVSFVATHVFYVISFVKTTFTVSGSEYVDFTSVLFKSDLLFIAIFLVVSAVILAFGKIKASPLLIPVTVYAVILGFMVAKAADLGFNLLYYRANTPACVVLIIGGLMFAISDLVLALTFFGEEKNWKKALNMGLYYAGQTLLAASLLLVRV